MSEEENNNSLSKVGAGIGGAGVGTMLILLADGLNNTELQYFLSLIAPSVSVAIGSFWLWFTPKVEKYFKNRELNKVVLRANQTLHDALENPNTSKEHRIQLQIQLEQLEMLRVDSDIKRIKVLIETEGSS